MSFSAMLGHMLRERLSRAAPLPRRPEPEPVMAAPESVAAFDAGGSAGGVLDPVCLFHAVQASTAIAPGARVLDLGCGPGNQLLRTARLNPHAQFLGVDCSDVMLDTARVNRAAAGTPNVEFAHADITDLGAFDDGAFDAVTCTMSLHHLADTAALGAALAAASRVLKPGGGIYLADFGRLRRAATLDYFAHENAERQGAAFTADFLASLWAAFSVAELDAAAAVLGPGTRRHTTALAPFLVVYRRRAEGARRGDAELRRRARELHDRLDAAARREFAALSAWFTLGGLGLPFDLGARP